MSRFSQISVGGIVDDTQRYLIWSFLGGEKGKQKKKMPGGHTGNHNANNHQTQVPHCDPVQQLLAAEKRAAETVTEARKRK
ncbi:unnamed protein product [Ceutorhynchus assimilis]|uniref:Uncharacterized protein n=1 Tax=Ceutorhynchus assimilis TaxID=467358 RepID=A0A9N9MH18_9CUCU|nr:unnamed protein product [Ceutorhynchus assimilis]